MPTARASSSSVGSPPSSRSRARCRRGSGAVSMTLSMAQRLSGALGARYPDPAVWPRLGSSRSLRPVRGDLRFRQHLRGQLLVLLQQAGGVGEDRGRFAQQRIRALVGELVAGGIGGDVAFADLEPVV